MLFVVLCPGTPEDSTGSGSGFKASQKTGQRLKVSSDNYFNMFFTGETSEHYLVYKKLFNIKLTWVARGRLVYFMSFISNQLAFTNTNCQE